jgi:hypothetical protein
METTKLSTFDAPLTISRRAAQAQEVFMQVAPVKVEPEPKRAAPAAAGAKAAKPAAAPLISSDDLMAGLASVLSPEVASTAPAAEPAVARAVAEPAAARAAAEGALTGADQDPVRTVNQRPLARAGAKEAGADAPKDRDETPEMERTHRIDLNAASPERTQRLDPVSTQPLHPERTQRVDPTTTQPFHPERTQRMQAEPDPAPPEQPAKPPDEATRTQRLDASIQKLQEAKRLLQGVTQKP